LKAGAEGFTLVEMAIALVIVGIVVTMLAGMMGPLRVTMKVSETNTNMNAAVDGLLGFAATNSRLPNLAQFPAVLRTQNDGWGKPVQYIFDNNLFNPPLGASICSMISTNITARICTDAACTTPTSVNNVAFMILSGGGNLNNQTAAGQAVGGAATINTYAPGIAVDNYGGDVNRPTDEYDDIVKWVTLPELQAKLSCGRCSAYEIYNGGVAGFFRVNGIGCGSIPNNILISSIASGGSIHGYGADPSCTAPGAASITFSQAALTDVNRNCAVNFNNTDR
jgi:prepilin-type N-terminal cleavage/methylation domain-containing protein